MKTVFSLPSNRNHRFVLALCAIFLAPTLAQASGTDCLYDLQDVAVVQDETGPDTPYVFVMPDNWNGELVTYIRGTTTQPHDFGNNLCFVADVATRNGFAVAASAFSEPAWAPQEVTRETHQLRGLFTAEYGAPARTFLWGRSSGGTVGQHMIEQYAPSQYDGALLECGTVGGATAQFEHMFTAGVLFDHYFAGALGYDVTDLPDDVDRDLGRLQITELILDDLGAAFQTDVSQYVGSCCRRIWGVTVCNPWCGGDFDLSTSSTLAVASVDQAQMVVRNIPVNAMLNSLDRQGFDLGLTPFQDFFIRTFMGNKRVPNILELGGQVGIQVASNLDETLETLTNGRPAFGNMDVLYTGSHDDTALNAGVPRMEAHPAAANVFTNAYNPDGNIGAPILTLHNAVDPSVPNFHETLLRDAVDAAGGSDLLVQQTVDRYDDIGHCDATRAESEGAFLDLVDWVHAGVVPVAGNVTGRSL